METYRLWSIHKKDGEEEKKMNMSRRRKHLYRDGARGAELRAFERRYGKRKGRYIYGATVGKVYRERHRRR